MGEQLKQQIGDVDSNLDGLRGLDRQKDLDTRIAKKETRDSLKNLAAEIKGEETEKQKEHKDRERDSQDLRQMEEEFFSKETSLDDITSRETSVDPASRIRRKMASLPDTLGPVDQSKEAAQGRKEGYAEAGGITTSAFAWLRSLGGPFRSLADKVLHTQEKELDEINS